MSLASIMRKWAFIAAVSLALASGFRVFAISANDVLARMGDQERFGYLSGVVDTFIYTETITTKEPTARSVCIRDWFYGKGGKSGTGPGQVVAMFRQYPDLSPAGLISVLINRNCGAPTGSTTVRP